MAQFAIIETGGHQYRVETGMNLQLEKIDAGEDDKILFEDVLLISDGEKSTIGQPLIERAVVEAKVISQGRDKKITVIKKWAKKRRELKRGHRQSFTEIEITKISVGTAKKTTAKKNSDATDEKKKKTVANKKKTAEEKPAKK